MKTIIKLIICFLLIPVNLNAQNTRLDSVEMLLKVNHLIYYSNNHSNIFNNSLEKELSEPQLNRIEIFSDFEEKFSLMILPNCKILYKLDTIYSSYFNNYNLLLFTHFGTRFKCDSRRYAISISDGYETDRFLLGVPKNGRLDSILYIAGDIYYSDLNFYPPLKNNLNLKNDSNFIKEIIRLRFEMYVQKYDVTKFDKIIRIGDYEIYGLKSEDPKSDMVYPSKIYFDTKKMIILDSKDEFKEMELKIENFKYWRDL